MSDFKLPGNVPDECKERILKAREELDVAQKKKLAERKKKDA